MRNRFLFYILKFHFPQNDFFYAPLQRIWNVDQRVHRKEDFYKIFLRKDKTPGVGLYGENSNIHEGTKTDLETKIQFERFQSVYAPSNSNEVVKKRIFFFSLL